MRVNSQDPSVNAREYRVSLNGVEMVDVVWADEETGEVCLFEHDWRSSSASNAAYRIPNSDDPSGTGIQTVVCRGTVVITRTVEDSQPTDTHEYLVVQELRMAEQDCRKQCFSLEIDGNQDSNYWILRSHKRSSGWLALVFDLVTPDAPRTLRLAIATPDYTWAWCSRAQQTDYRIWTTSGPTWQNWSDSLDPLIYRPKRQSQP
jgi:hypothetical protein